MKDRILPGELWLFGCGLVFIPPEGSKVGLTFGIKPMWLPGEKKIDTKIKLSDEHMRWQYLPVDRRPGMGWEYFGFENLDKKIPEKAKISIMKLIFNDIPKSIKKKLI